MKTDNIWSSYEMYCVSSGLDYEADYLDTHKKNGYQHAALSKEGYELLKKLFDLEFEKDQT